MASGDGEQRRHHRHHHGHRRHEDRRDAEAHDVRQRLDVIGRAGDEVAGAGALDRGQRQVDRAPHELLAQLGEDGLAEHERRALRAAQVRAVCSTTVAASITARRSTSATVPCR